MNYYFTEGVKWWEHVEKARQAQGFTDDFPVPVGPIILKGAAPVSIQSANKSPNSPDHNIRRVWATLNVRAIRTFESHDIMWTTGYAVKVTMGSEFFEAGRHPLGIYSPPTRVSMRCSEVWQVLIFWRAKYDKINIRIPRGLDHHLIWHTTIDNPSRGNGGTQLRFNFG